MREEVTVTEVTVVVTGNGRGGDGNGAEMIYLPPRLSEERWN